MSVIDFVAFLNTTQIHRIISVMFIAFLGIGLGVGFSVSVSDARKASEDDVARQQNLFSQWQMDLTSQLTKASSLSATLGAFALATVKTPTNLSAPAADRIRYLDQAAFDLVGQKIFFRGITCLVIAPGGVVSQAYPAGSAPLGFDLYSSPTYANLFPIFVEANGVYITGPTKLVSRAGFGVFVWFPIHITNVSNIDNFFGVAYVMIDIPILVDSLNTSARMDAQSMEYALWYVDDGTTSDATVIVESDAAVTPTIMAEGMRFVLPISQQGRTAYMAMYPRGGPVSSSIKGTTAAVICIVTILGSGLIVLIVYIAAYVHFLYRHRDAPSIGSTMYVAALALRGAQPIADRAPLVAVQMFKDFNVSVRNLAMSNHCYPVCEVGDRCVYVVANNPRSIMKLAQEAVLHVIVQGTINSADHVHRSVRSASRGKTATHMTEDVTESSFIGAATCRASVACHTITAAGIYDDVKDTYFYGTAAQLGKLCGALDLAKCGEVCWTDAFADRNTELCLEIASEALTSHTVSENGEVILHVASWWKESGDERDNEDPSTAMAVLSDAYVRRMTVFVSQGKTESKEQRKRDGEETKSGSSNRSHEATALTRSATLLHVAILNGDEKTALEVVRRIVGEEKGAVVSAHEATIVAAYNLLSAGGHHQVRAADTVMRLRDALCNTNHFVCSISHGKVNALIMDGLVMCTGEAVTRGRTLLQEAISLSPISEPTDGVTYFSSDSETGAAERAPPKRYSTTKSNPESYGLCLLVCSDELSSTYDCEAIDVMSSGSSKPKVVYRLAFRLSGKANDDEWMYRLKDEEDGSPFAIINAVFRKIATAEHIDAARLWAEHSAALSSNGQVSSFAKASLARRLK